MCMRIETKCEQCEKPLVRYAKTPNKRFFCSRSCCAEGSRGEKNANFGNHWTSEQRALQSEKISETMTLERRVKIGLVHRGKVESEETRRRKSESHKGKKPYEMTDEIRQNIGRGSSAKFTDAYKKKDRKRREELGLVIPLVQKDDYLLYRDFANWLERMFDYVTDESQIKLLQERGVFNNKTNIEGVVRDHMFSRRSGFQQGVFPELMRHPCNLQLLTHGENVGKAQRKEKNDHQTLSELLS